MGPELLHLIETTLETPEKVVKQIGGVVVQAIVKTHQPANDIVFQTSLFDAIPTLPGYIAGCSFRYVFQDRVPWYSYMSEILRTGDGNAS